MKCARVPECSLNSADYPTGAQAKLRENFLGAGRGMALRVEHAPPIERVDGDEDGRICAICKQNCYFSFVACACDMGRNVCLNCVQASPPPRLAHQGPPPRRSAVPIRKRNKQRV